MSLWKRLFGVEDEELEPPAEVEMAVSASSSVQDEGYFAEELLRDLAQPADEPPDPERVLQLLRELSSQGRQARAIELVRRVLSQYPKLDPVPLELADLLATRGDEPGALRVLRPVVERRDAPLRALMLAGELAEHQGDRELALAHYERVIARNVDFPQARERVGRLREARESRRELAGATLLTDGALARGRYRVLRELGRGGAGTVFAARDDQLGREVALKMYHKRNRLEQERLLVEARVPARIEHPGVVRVLDLDQRLGALVMEWVHGGSVRQELRKGDFDLPRAFRWLRTALEALGFVHAQGFVHRDVKPSNFLLRDDDSVVLTDFGLAARLGDQLPGKRGGGEGTLAYMAPEQRGGAAAAPPQDVHAFGATMREIFDLVPAPVPSELYELAAACTRKGPEDRPTVGELREEMNR